VLGSLALAGACSGQPPADRAAPRADARRVDPSKAGRISGRVVIQGAVPENSRVSVASVPACARAHPDGVQLETSLAENGGLNNVFVYVKNGLGNYYFDTPAEAVKLDQQGCRYTPHVFGARAGQPIHISNSDATPHNVSAAASANQGFNFAQPIQGLVTTKTFTAPEVMVRFKCDIHPWMTAYGGILDHPYFAVTANGGQFELAGVPAGTYTVEAWHEKLGTQTGNVTLADNGSQQMTFTFNPPASAEQRLRPARGAGVPNAAAALGWPAGGKRGGAEPPSASERGWGPASTEQ
jgi:plastocyanin